MSRGIERPPAWAVIALVVGAVWLIVGGAIYASRDQPTAAASPPSSTPQPSEPEERPTLAVLGDSYSAGTQYGGRDAAGWPALLAAENDWGLCLEAVGGSGFANPGTADGPFTDDERLGAIIGCEPDVVVIAVAANDAGLPVEQVRPAVEEVFDRMAADLPDAQVVLVGPIFRTDPPPAEVQTLHDLLAQEAEQAGVEHVEALTWFADRPELIGADGAHPTDEGHAFLAEQIGGALDELGVLT